MRCAKPNQFIIPLTQKISDFRSWCSGNRGPFPEIIVFVQWKLSGQGPLNRQLVNRKLLFELNKINESSIVHFVSNLWV